MTEIERWRRNADLSRPDMFAKMDIPVRTIENWENGERKCPGYVERLVVKELKELTEKRLEERGRKRMETLKSDEDGRRPAGSWAMLCFSGDDCFVWLYGCMQEAIDKAKYETGTGQAVQVAYIICSQKEDGSLEPWYVDRDGNVESDYDYVDFSMGEE